MFSSFFVDNSLPFFVHIFLCQTVHDKNYLFSYHLTTLQYMKIIQNKQQILVRKTSATKPIENKQNQPVNALQKIKRVGNKADNVKIGQQIKHKIRRMFENGVNQQQNEPLVQFDLNSNFELSVELRSDLSLTKSVSFEERNQSPKLLRHNSKKSILKKSLSSSQSSQSLMQSQVSLANSHVGSQDQSTQNIVGNKTIKAKYQSILSQLKQNKRKYTDQVYPPAKSSIYLNNSLMKSFCQMFEKEGRAIQWMRISQLFASKKLTVWTTQRDKKSYVLNGPMSKTSDYLPSAFNLIRDKNSILEKMFESQKINKEGIYYIKIHQTQQNIWKYVVVDDYIPVIVNKKIPLTERYLPEHVYPAFMNVQSYHQTLEIWPFLLQKAYAKYYSTYDSLANGFIYDFMEQIAGIFLQGQVIKDNIDKVNKLIKNEDTLLLGEDKRGIFYPISNSNLENPSIFCTYLDKDCNFIERSLNIEDFTAKFHTIHYSYLHKYYHTSKCQVQQQKVRNSKQHDGFILRHITIDDVSQCQMGVVQKQQRFYRNLLTYQYAWMRMILVQQESDGYRWIISAYSNHKTTKLLASLVPGKYILIIIPQWNDKNHDFNLIYNGTVAASFQRHSYEPHRNIIQSSCMDLAQRFGKLTQISKNICSYHYIERNIGFIIENVNNQKQYGHVRILRSIEGLQKFNIKPINPEFNFQQTIEIVIPNAKHFTVVLMTTKGVNQTIFDKFDFGCS